MSVSVTEQKHSAAFYHLKSDPLSSCGSAFLDSGPFFFVVVVVDASHISWQSGRTLINGIWVCRGRSDLSNASFFDFFPERNYDHKLLRER